MSKYQVQPSGKEAFFDVSEIIVSKTDMKGRIEYANDVFLNIAGYTEEECLGEPHSMIRHPKMPRAVFKLLWETIERKEEIFAYVINMTKSGDHYWVFAHVTPSLDDNGNVIGFHSNRRVPGRDAVAKVEKLYADLVATEQKHANAKDGLQASYDQLISFVNDNGGKYEELIFNI